MLSEECCILHHQSEKRTKLWFSELLRAISFLSEKLQMVQSTLQFKHLKNLWNVDVHINVSSFLPLDWILLVSSPWHSFSSPCLPLNTYYKKQDLILFYFYGHKYVHTVQVLSTHLVCILPDARTQQHRPILSSCNVSEAIRPGTVQEWLFF